MVHKSIFDNDARRNQPREMLMVSEYLAKKGLYKNSQQRVRVGAPHPELTQTVPELENTNILYAYSRWADAILFNDDKITIIEAKIRPVLGPLEALLLYERLFKSDPRYFEHHKKPIEKLFLYAVEDPVVVRIAHELGIKTELYEPSFLEDYKKIIRGRETRAPYTNLP